MDMNLFLRMKEIVWIEKEKNIYDFCKRTNIFHVLELILMRMPMQGIKFRDFMSVVCTSNWNGSPARSKLNKGKHCFALSLFPVSK